MRARTDRPTSRRRGYSLLEVLIALAILIAGIVGILYFFPPTLRASHEAALRGRAALLAQQKAEELRRDSDEAGLLIEAIQTLAVETPPVVFPEDPRLMYSYHSRSVLNQDADPSNPAAAPNVARVIIRRNPANFGGHDEVIYELRFDHGS